MEIKKDDFVVILETCKWHDTITKDIIKQFVIAKVKQEYSETDHYRIDLNTLKVEYFPDDYDMRSGEIENELLEIWRKVNETTYKRIWVKG